MMFPYVPVPEYRSETVSVFRGWQPDEATCPENGFTRMENGCGQQSPGLCTRPPRQTALTLTNPRGLTAHSRLCWVDGDTLYYNGKSVGQVSDSEKTFVNMGAWILIFPDKLRFSTVDQTVEPLEATFVTTGETVVTLCRGDGEAYEYVSSPTAPDDPKAGQVWLDTSGETACLKIYSAATGLWSTIESTNLKVSSPNIGENFAQYDGVTFENAGVLNGTHVIAQREKDSLVIAGILANTLTLPIGVKLSRTLPDMDYICEYANRLWGCNSEKHEIYASRLGDPTNFSCFEGLSTDSYTVTVGTPGVFTGCIAYGSSVVFFKEDVLHRLYGTLPSNFQMVTVHGPGVKNGCAKSLQNGSETLYYQGPGGVYAYAGGQPARIDSALSPLQLQNARGGYGRGVYVLMGQEENGQAHFLRYEEPNGTWYREDGSDVMDFAGMAGEVWFLTRQGALIRTAAQGSSLLLEGPGGEKEEDIPFCFVTGRLGMDLPGQKVYRRVQVRLLMEEGAFCRLSLSRDGGEWEPKGTFTARHTGRFTLPLIPGRCDTCRLKLEGTGQVTLIALHRLRERGSDL